MTMLSSTPIPMSISTSNPTSSMAFSSPAAFMGSSGFSSTSSASSPSSSNVRPIHDIAFSSYAFSTSAASLLGVSSSSLTSASLASPAAVVHSGTLLKRQPLFTWSERYVLLTSSEFFWYKRDRHSPLPATFHHSAPSFSSSSPSPSPAPAPAPSPAAVWGEERGHWYVADIAIRYESEKRTFVLANTNMSASAQLQSQSHSHQSILQLVKETSAERERDSQHEIHLKATNDFEYLAWQHAFQQVIRNQEKKKSERNKNVKEKEKEKEKEQNDERTAQKHENEEETLRKMAAVLPLHQRHNSAPFSPEAGEPSPASVSGHTQNRRVRPLTHPTLTPPPSSSAEASSNSSFHQWNSTPNSSGMRKKRSSEPPQRTRTNTSPLKHLNIESDSNASKCPAIYLVSVILPPSLLTSILPGFSSSLFPLLLWPIPSNSATALSEFVIHRPLSSFSSSSSVSSAALSSSSMFPVSFLVPSILCCATSLLRFTLTDGTLLNFPLSRLHEDSLISNRQQGKITVSDGSSGVEVDVQWEEREDNQTRRRRKETGQKCSPSSTPAIGIYAVLAALILCSVFFGACFASSSTFTMLCIAFAWVGFLLLAAALNCLWSRAGRTRGKNYYVLNVTALRVKEASDRPLVDLKANATDPAEVAIDKSMAGLRKRVPSSSKPGSGFVSVQSHTQSYRQKNDLQVASQTFDLVSNILLTGKQ